MVILLKFIELKLRIKFLVSVSVRNSIRPKPKLRPKLRPIPAEIVRPKLRSSLPNHRNGHKTSFFPQFLPFSSFFFKVSNQLPNMWISIGSSTDWNWNSNEICTSSRIQFVLQKIIVPLYLNKIDFLNHFLAWDSAEASGFGRTQF